MKKLNKVGKISFQNDTEIDTSKSVFESLFSKKIPNDEILENLGIFFTSKNLSRILCLNDLYQKQIELHGNILDYGTRWGQNACIFALLRGIYEPFNRHKKIYAFDTFEGFNKINKLDGASKLMKKGNLATTKNYHKFLEKQLSNIERNNPLSHIKKFDVLKGDAVKKTQELIRQNKHLIISMVYFDFDVYEPTYECLEIIKPRLVKGSVVAFDELNDPESPGETLALMKSFGLNKIKLKRHRYASRISYFIFE